MTTKSKKDKFKCDFANSAGDMVFSNVRKSCEGLSFFRDFEGKSYCVLHYPDEDKIEEFNKALKQKIDNKDFNFCGVWFPKEINFDHFIFDSEVDFYKAHFNKIVSFNYTTFLKRVDFNTTTFKEHCVFIQSKFKEWTSFLHTEFEGNANFADAEFSEEVIFMKTSFKGFSVFPFTKFAKKSDFCDAIFNQPADFSRVIFESLVNFDRTHFLEECSFKYATFTSYVYLRNSIFEKKVSFNFARIGGSFDISYSTFKDSIQFSGVEHLTNRLIDIFYQNSRLIFDFANIEHFEKVSFHSAILRPSWFVNIDPRKFVFINVIWDRADGKRINVKAELEELKQRRVSNQFRLLTIACRQLAENAEENNRLEEASNFRKMALETEWLEKSVESQKWFDEIVFASEKIKRWFSFKEVDLLAPLKKVLYIIRHFDFLHPLYRFTSYYGESWRRAFIILFVILAISTFLYMTSYSVFKDGQQGFNIWEAISYSLRVMALQRPEPFPENSFAKMVVAFETILAPLQLALLALAIRRKFMR